MVLRRACVPIGFSLNSPQTCLSFTEILFRKLKIHTLLQTHTDLTFMCMFYAVDLSQCCCCDVMSCDANFSKEDTATTELSLSGQRSQSNYERGQAFCQSESPLTDRRSASLSNLDEKSCFQFHYQQSESTYDKV